MCDDESQTRPKNSDIDGVGILAILQLPTGPALLLQKQFRPPIGKVTIEIPAGLVDEGESAAEAAVRELKEETGYVGQARGDEGVVMFNGSFQKYFSLPSPLFLQALPPTRKLGPTPNSNNNKTPFTTPNLNSLYSPSDPGFCNTNLRMVTVDIDMSLPENQAPQPHLEENEFIEVFTVPLGELYAACQRLEREGYAIDARVGTLAEGLEVARRVGL